MVQMNRAKWYQFVFMSLNIAFHPVKPSSDIIVDISVNCRHAG